MSPLLLGVLLLATGRAAAGPVPCSAWAAQQLGSGLPPAIGPTSSQRQALLATGGGLRPVEERYYAAWFPASWEAAPVRRVLVALHGTGGAPEAEWNDWHANLEPRGWAFLGLSYLDQATGRFDDDATIYRHLEKAIAEVAAACDLGGSRFYLLGFSRGSAMSFPVAYHDLHGGWHFTATVGNSGAWIPGQPLYPTLAAIEQRGDRGAFAGARFWLYCGERDSAHGYPMCDEMDNARRFVEAYGGQVETIYRDPSGSHGDLVRSPDALRAMFAYLEALR